MRCPYCSADNPVGMKFCGQCGSPLGATCPSCGSGNPPGHRFCGHCGAPLPLPDPRPRVGEGSAGATALPGEMKQVTVLFCDIVDSTPLTERLGPEAMRDLVNSFLETSLAEVRRYGGSAPQFSGDGFMAVFGAPLAQEDHVRRALLAAIAIQRALGVGGTGPDRLHPPVRIGIHTGPAVFGPVGGGLAMSPTVIGDTANLAARLQQVAEPGTILLSEATHLLAEDYARVEPVGPLALKGIAERTAAYRLLGVSQQRPSLDVTITARPAVFVGRDRELAVLNDFLAQAESGQGRALGVVGEPGIGKSRLLAEFRRQLPEGRITWVEGRCLSYGSSIPYLLVLDVLRSNCGIIETDTPEVITDKIRQGLREVGLDSDVDGPVLLNVLGIKDGATLPALSNPEAVKSKTFEVLRALCIKGSQRRPLVLVLEDLHWIDNISEEFIGASADDLPGTRILLISTHRPGYRPLWTEKPYAEEIALHPLTREDSVRMVRSVLRAEPLVDVVTEEIVAKAEGNPLFLEQLALHAKDLRLDLMVPNTIHDVVMARIDRLPLEMKQLLQIASVIGREFSLRLVGAVWNGSGSLEHRLQELSHLEFINERLEPDGIVYGFRHALTQETVYGSLLERHRRAYHGAVGGALEEWYTGRAEEVAEMLALHFGRSDEAEKAVDYSILAAEKAQRRWANNEALGYFGDALRRLDAMPDTEANRLRRIDAVIKQAEVKFALGQHADHIAALDQIAGLVHLADDTRRRATWHYWRGFVGVLTGGQPDIAIDHCNVAARLAADVGLDDIKAFAECCLAQVYTVVGRLRDAVAVGESALSSFEARGNPWWAGRTLGHLTWAANALGDWEASLNYCHRALEHANVLDDLRLKTRGLWRMASACVQQGDLKCAFECCSEVLSLSPIPYDIAMARAVRGYAEIKAGRVDAGLAELIEAAEWFESAHLRHSHLRLDLWLAEAHLVRGDRASAQPLIEEVLRASRETGYPYFEGLACWLMGECRARETPLEAAEWVETAINILERIDARNDLAKAMITRASLFQREGDVAGARQMLERAGAIFRALGTRDEPVKLEMALDSLGRGSQIRLLSEGM